MDTNMSMTLLFVILPNSALFRSCGTFDYVLRVYYLQYKWANIRTYLRSSHGHELSGHVSTHTYNYTPGQVLQISL